MDIARARIAEAEAAEVTAGARPNPTLGAGFDYNFDIPAGSPWTYGFDLSVPVELGGKRSRRMDAAESRTEVARLELGETAWRVYSRVRDRLVGCLLAAEDALAAQAAVEAHEEWQGLVAREGQPWGVETVLRGASERLVPVLMTALVTALGILPIALGGEETGREIEGPMAIVILGGLVTSTALNLLVLPVLALRHGRFGVPRDDA